MIFRGIFNPAYAVTTHSSQGMSISEPYTIHEWDRMDQRLKYDPLQLASRGWSGPAILPTWDWTNNRKVISPMLHPLHQAGGVCRVKTTLYIIQAARHCCSCPLRSGLRWKRSTKKKNQFIACILCDVVMSSLWFCSWLLIHGLYPLVLSLFVDPWAVPYTSRWLRCIRIKYLFSYIDSRCSQREIIFHFSFPMIYI